MSDNEYEEFQEYIKQRDSEYRELILNSWNYFFINNIYFIFFFSDYLIFNNF
jgi:hypothetical protein